MVLVRVRKDTKFLDYFMYYLQNKNMQTIFLKQNSRVNSTLGSCGSFDENMGSTFNDVVTKYHMEPKVFTVFDRTKCTSESCQLSYAKPNRCQHFHVLFSNDLAATFTNKNVLTCDVLACFLFFHKWIIFPGIGKISLLIQSYLFPRPFNENFKFL